MNEQREPELEEIDEYEGKESPQKRRLVRWVLFGILAVIVVLGVWKYQEVQLAQERMDRVKASGPMPATR
jgi:cytochrome c-type biogenesis protein CcmH/NrfG